MNPSNPPLPALDHYPMNTSPIGLALVISNINFESTKLKSRGEGGMKDYENFTKLLEELGFEIYKYKEKSTQDLTRHEMEDVITSFAGDDKHKNYSCCLVCVMTHGCGESSVYGTILLGTDCGKNTSEGHGVSVKWMLHQFSEVHHPALSGKPMLFFIQACRSGMGRSCQETISPNHPSFPLQNHIYMVFATLPGNVSKRGKKGSRLIVNSCDVIREKRDHEDLHSMMTEVIRRIRNMNKSGNSETQTVVQIPQIITSMDNKIYFPLSKGAERTNLEEILKRLNRRRSLLTGNYHGNNPETFSDVIVKDTYNVVKIMNSEMIDHKVRSSDYITFLHENLKCGNYKSEEWDLEKDFITLKNKKTLIVGFAGTGKTTFCAQLVANYIKGTFRSYNRLIFLELRRLSKEQKKYSKQEFLEQFGYDADRWKAENAEDKDVLYILDGFDEIAAEFRTWSERLNWNSERGERKTDYGWIRDIMRNAKHSIVTSRPSGLDCLREYFNEDQFLHLLGFTESEIDRIFESRNLKDALQNIKLNLSLYVHLCIPVTCMMVIRVLEEQQGTDNSFLSSNLKLYAKFTAMQIAHHQHLSVKFRSMGWNFSRLFSLFQSYFDSILSNKNQLPEPLEDQGAILEEILKLSKDIVSENFSLTTDSYSEGHENPIVKAADNSGIFAVEDVIGSTINPQKIIFPIHNTITEFLAALYMFKAVKDMKFEHNGKSNLICSTTIEKKFFVSMMAGIELEVKTVDPVKHDQMSAIIRSASDISKASENGRNNEAIEMAMEIENLDSEWFAPIITRALAELVNHECITIDGDDPLGASARLTLLDRSVAAKKIDPPSKLVLIDTLRAAAPLLRVVFSNALLQQNITAITLKGLPHTFSAPMLQQFTQLKTVYVIDHLYFLVSSIIGVTGLLKSLPLGITSLTLEQCDLSFEDEQPQFTQFTQLKTLDVNSSEMGDTGLTNLLNSLPLGITSLDLRNCRLLFANEQPQLRQFTQLETLNVNNNKIGDGGLTNLLNSLPLALNELIIWGCGLSFSWEQPAMKRLTQLRSLNVRENDIDATGLHNLRASIPESLQRLLLPEHCKDSWMKQSQPLAHENNVIFLG